jgi:hypothetical protein
MDDEQKAAAAAAAAAMQTKPLAGLTTTAAERSEAGYEAVAAAAFGKLGLAAVSGVMYAELLGICCVYVVLEVGWEGGGGGRVLQGSGAKSGLAVNQEWECIHWGCIQLLSYHRLGRQSHCCCCSIQL